MRSHHDGGIQGPGVTRKKEDLTDVNLERKDLYGGERWDCGAVLESPNNEKTKGKQKETDGVCATSSWMGGTCEPLGGGGNLMAYKRLWQKERPKNIKSSKTARLQPNEKGHGANRSHRLRRAAVISRRHQASTECTSCRYNSTSLIPVRIATIQGRAPPIKTK